MNVQQEEENKKVEKKVERRHTFKWELTMRFGEVLCTHIWCDLSAFFALLVNELVR